MQYSRVTNNRPRTLLILGRKCTKYAFGPSGTLIIFGGLVLPYLKNRTLSMVEYDFLSVIFTLDAYKVEDA